MSPPVFSFVFSAGFFLLLGGGSLLFFWRQKKPAPFLVLWAVFFVYLDQVLELTLIQFQSLVLLKGFFPQLMLNGQPSGDQINLVPLLGLTARDLKTSLLNVLMMVPFGLGLPYLSRLRMRGVVIVGAAFSLAIEAAQYTLGQVSGVAFRIADINDFVFNTVGTTVGYLLAVASFRVLQTIPSRWLAESSFIAYVKALRTR